jgi:hypothetical protein
MKCSFPIFLRYSIANHKHPFSKDVDQNCAYLLISVWEVLVEKGLSLIEFEEDILELLELLGVTAVATNLSDLLTDGEHSREFHL